MSYEDYKTKKSVVIVYTGDSKGKTSASLGLLVRALGNRWNVSFIQFIKYWGVGEHVFIRDIMPLYKDQLHFYKGGKGFYDAGDLSEKGISEATGLGESPSVFDDPESLRNLLGDNPRWVWNIDPTRSRPDPMLIPWVAEKLLYEARDAEAKALEGLGKLDEALKIYNSLLTQVTDPQYRVTLEERVADLTAKIAERDRLMAAQGAPATQPEGPAIIEPELPQYVLTETRGIIYDPAGDSFIAVGDQNLRVGEAVEGFPSVRVKSISYQTAVFSVTNESMTKDFVVKVQGDILEIVE